MIAKTKSMPLAALLLALCACGSDKYDDWGAYYRTQRRIIDGDRSESVARENHAAFDRLVAAGEIIEVSWDVSRRGSMDEYLMMHGIRELRYGPAIDGGQWPTRADGGGGGFFYKLDAELIQLRMRRLDDGAGDPASTAGQPEANPKPKAAVQRSPSSATGTSNWSPPSR